MMTLKSPQFFRDEYLPMLSRTVSYVQTARALGISEASIYVWLRESKAAMTRGDDPSDYFFEYEGEGPRWLHQWAKLAIKASISDTEANARARARDGFWRECKFQGRSVPKYSDDWLDEGMRELLGLTDKDMYARDPKTGKLVYEMEWVPPATDLVIAVLQANSETYRRRSSVDVNMRAQVSGGVMLVGGNRPAAPKIAAPLLEIVQDAIAEPERASTEEEPLADFTELDEPDTTVTDTPAEPVDDEPDTEPVPTPTAPVSYSVPTPPELAPTLQTGPLAPPRRALSSLERDLLTRLSGTPEQRSAPVIIPDRLDRRK
jgi:hypothetical protein